MKTIIYLKKFGEMLISRPAGREAWLVAQAYSLPKETKSVTLDFAGVSVLSPSWADEFITKLVERYGLDNVRFVHTKNLSVKATLQTLLGI